MNEEMIKEFMDLTDAESLREYDPNLFSTENSVSFPLADIAALGSAFAVLPAAFANVNVMAGGKRLFEATFPVEGNMMKTNDGLLGAIVDNKHQIVGQTRFKEVKGAAQGAANASTLFMVLAIMAINKSLKDISENQKQIISFLEIDKQTKLKGDLITLTDIISDYHFSIMEDSGIKLFADKICLINKMYNEPIKIIFDDKNVYLPLNKAA